MCLIICHKLCHHIAVIVHDYVCLLLMSKLFELDYQIWYDNTREGFMDWLLGHRTRMDSWCVGPAGTLLLLFKTKCRSLNMNQFCSKMREIDVKLCVACHC